MTQPGGEAEQPNNRDELGRLVTRSNSKPALNGDIYLEDSYWNPVRFTLLFHRNEFHEWTGRFWRKIDASHVESQLYETFKTAVFFDQGAGGVIRINDYDINPGRTTALMQALKNRMYLDSAANVPTWLCPGEQGTFVIEPPIPAREVIACRNMLLHASTRRVFAHTPRLFNAVSVDYDYLAQAPQPRAWLSFLNEIWPDDSESIDALQEIFGYCLTARTDLQKMFMLIGPPRSGKGTIVRVLTALLGGDSAVTSVSLADLNQRFGLEHLESKQLGIMQDARFRSRDDGVAVERLLSITGEDEVSIDKKNKGIYSAKLPTRFLLVSNEIPIMQDESGALRSRMLILKTLDTVSEDRRNSRLVESFWSELPSILNWALNGLDRLNLRGTFQQPKSAQLEVETMSKLSSDMESFAEDYLIEDASSMIRHKDFYAVYRAWCKEMGIAHPKKAAVVGRDLRGKFPRVDSKQRTFDGVKEWYYLGIGLTDSGHQILNVESFLDGL